MPHVDIELEDNKQFISNIPRICMKCQVLFSGKNKKKYFSMLSAENFTQSAKHCNMYEREHIMCKHTAKALMRLQKYAG